MILAKNITYGYSRLMVYGDSIYSIQNGETVALVGPNGAGKSILLKLPMGDESFPIILDEGAES